MLAPDLGLGSVGAGQLATGAVTASKLAADSVGGGSVANGSLQTVDIGSFAGSVNVDFRPFNDREPLPGRRGAGRRPTGGQPNIADDVIVVSPPSGGPISSSSAGKPAPGNAIRIVACWPAPAGRRRPTRR